MAHIRDFEPILPDPQPYVEKALALYERAVREKHGRIVFIAAELGGGKTDLLNALAEALHQARPEPNFVAGSFRGGEYHPQTLDWQAKICLKKAVLAVGETAALLGFFPGLYAFAASFTGQLLQTSASAHEFGNEFKKHPSPGRESADWLRKLLRRTAEEKPLVCLLDDWDEAQRFYWDDMLLTSSREIARDLPLLMFLTVKEPINLVAPEQDDSGLTMVIKTLTDKGLAEWWPLRKLSCDEVANTIGPAAPGIAAKLHGVTSGNARWVQELWREWRLNEIVVVSKADRWVWGPQHEETINLYDDILRGRLARLLNVETAMGVEEVRELLACAALEGTRFTAEAVALALGWDRDDLIDFLDEKLVQSEDNPDGLLLEDDNVNILTSDGATSTIWRYTFVSELHWLALERYGFANVERPDKRDSERLEKMAALVKALEQTYGSEERFGAAPLARLLRGLGNTEAAQHYQRLHDYSANCEMMCEHARYLLTIDKDDWNQQQCRQVTEFLVETGKAMLNVFPYGETRAVLEEAITLAHRAKCESDEACARYLCGFILWSEGDNKAARNSINVSLGIFSRIREKSGMSVALQLLAQIDFTEGRYEDSRRHGEESMGISRATGNRDGIAGSMLLLAEIDCAEGHLAQGRRQGLQALGFYRKFRREGTAACLHLLAEIDYAESRYDSARSQAAEALAINQEICNRAKTAQSLDLLAEINCAEGRYDVARIQAKQCFEISRDIGNREGIALSLQRLAQIDYGEGHFGAALNQATQSFEIHQEIGRRNGTAGSLFLLAQINYAEGRYQAAHNQATQSLKIHQQVGSPEGAAVSLSLLAQVEYAEGRYQDALRQANQALGIHQECGNRREAAISLHLLGGIAVKLERPREAFDLISLSAMILREIGLPAARLVRNDLVVLIVADNYGKEQLVEMNQQVLDNYRKDGGKELIENAVARLREADR